MSDEAALEFLLSAGAPSVSFADQSMKGKWVVGTIVSMDLTQQTDFQTKAPKFYDDEKQRPMMQVVFTLQTDERNPEIEDDDGVRRLFAKGQMIGAIKNAIKKAGHAGDVKGGKLGVCWTGDGEAKNNLAPPKLYQAKFGPPEATAVLDQAEPVVDGEDLSDFSEEPF